MEDANYYAKCRQCHHGTLILCPKVTKESPDVVYCPECTQREPIENVLWVKQ